MKRTIIYSILATLMLFTACRKSDNPKIPTLTRVPLPLLIKDASGSQTVSAVTPLTFNGKFSVDLYFKDDVKPTKLDVVVRKNGDNTNVKLFQANVTTYPTAITVTGAQLIAMFGPIVLNDKFEFGANITAQDGTIYEAFPVLGVPFGSGVLNQPGSSPTVIFQAVCNYDDTIYQGAFTAFDPDFQDADGATIILTRISTTQFSFKYPSIINCIPLVVTVNPVNNTAVISGAPSTSTGTPPLVVGTRWDPAYGYPNTATYANPSIQYAANGVVSPCDKTVFFNIQWGTAGGTLVFGGGPYRFKLTKQ